MTVRVPLAVLSGISAVRESGLTNMFDCGRVADLSDELGYPRAAEWVRGHRAEYARGVFEGFEADEQGAQ